MPLTKQLGAACSTSPCGPGWKPRSGVNGEVHRMLSCICGEDGTVAAGGVGPPSLPPWNRPRLISVLCLPH